MALLAEVLMKSFPLAKFNKYIAVMECYKAGGNFKKSCPRGSAVPVSYRAVLSQRP